MTRLAVVAIIESDDPRLAGTDTEAMWLAINEAVLSRVVQVVAAVSETDAALMLHAHAHAMAQVGRPLGKVRGVSVRRH
jgi:hypothetical protein